MYYKDKDGKPHQGPIPAHHLSKLLAEGGSEIAYEEFTAIQVAMNTPPEPTKAERLLLAASELKSDMQSLTLSYAAADISGNATGKASILQEIADRKAQYATDVAAIRSGS